VGTHAIGPRPENWDAGVEPVGCRQAGREIQEKSTDSGGWPYRTGWGEGPVVPDDFFYHLIDILDEIAAETQKSVAQVALNWLLQRPTISNIVIGARTEEQLKENLGCNRMEPHFETGAKNWMRQATKPLFILIGINAIIWH
jgi:hypothetical protein